MIDLQRSLRPAAPPPPPPVGQIMARAMRRRRRRRAVGAGVLVSGGLVWVALVGIDPLGPRDVTVTDAVGEPTSAEMAEIVEQPEEATPSTTTEAPGNDSVTSAAIEPEIASATDPETPAETRPETTPGITTEHETTSEWEDGYCVQVEVANRSADPSRWQVVVDLGGVIASAWNATAVELDREVFVFSGVDGYNATLGSGGATSFGACVDTSTARPPPGG